MVTTQRCALGKDSSVGLFSNMLLENAGQGRELPTAVVSEVSFILKAVSVSSPSAKSLLLDVFVCLSWPAALLLSFFFYFLMCVAHTESSTFVDHPDIFTCGTTNLVSLWPAGVYIYIYFFFNLTNGPLIFQLSQLQSEVAAVRPLASMLLHFVTYNRPPNWAESPRIYSFCDQNFIKPSSNKTRNPILKRCFRWTYRATSSWLIGNSNLLYFMAVKVK